MTTAELSASDAAGLVSPQARSVSSTASRLGALALAALPGVLTLYLSFNSGGFFPRSQGAVAAVLATAVVLRMAFVGNPFAGFSRPLLLAIAALGAYSVWSLLSAQWSHAPSRALLNFDLANIYVLALLLFGSSTRSHRRVRWTMMLTWFSMLGVCVVSLATRFRPDLFAAPVSLSPNRLAFPLTYWNALGLFAAIGITLALYFATSTREPRAMRVLGTAAIPVFGVTILLTYSRGAIIVGAAGLIVYALLARPRGLVSVLLTAGPTTVFAIAETYQAKLVSNAIVSPAAVQEGRHLTMSLLIACVAAALGRIALLELDTRLVRLMMSSTRRHNARILLAIACAAAIAGGVLGFGHQIAHQWQSFTKQDSSLGANDVRNRINTLSFASRLPGWRIALQAFDHNEFHGHGAGTYNLDFYRLRPDGGVALNAHSLYLEAMGELGVIGLAAVVIAILCLVVACFARSRRASRSLWITLGVVGTIWAVHAGVDWDWEMPAVTLPVVALAAGGLARRSGTTRLRPAIQLPLRVLIAVVCLTVAVIGLRISVSDARFTGAVAAFDAGNCPAAVADAGQAISAMSSRPQPYAIIGYCDVMVGAPKPAVGLMEQAVARDPQNWRYYYGLAVARAAAGRDPHLALAEARTLNPQEQMITTTAALLRGRDAKHWRRAALAAEMPVSTLQ